MISVRKIIVTESTLCKLLIEHLHGNFGNGRNTALGRTVKYSCSNYGSLSFQETCKRTCAAATSTTVYGSQTLKYHKDLRNPEHSLQQHEDLSHHAHPKSIKTKKYFGNIETLTHKSELPLKDKNIKSFNLKSIKNKKITSKPKTNSVHNLLNFAKHGHIQKAEKILQELEASDQFRVGEGILISLMGMYIAAEQLPPALATLRRLHSLHPHAALSIPTVLSLATLMLHDGQTKECITLLAEEASLIEAAKSSASSLGEDDRLMESVDSSVVPEKKGKDKNIARRTSYSDKMCHSLLMVPAARGDVSATEQVLEALLCNLYTKPSRVLLGPLVQAHIACRDWDGALTTLERIAKEHNCLPCRPELMKALVDLKDTHRLQRVVELSGEVIGNENALLDLAICFLESDDTNKAIEIIKMIEEMNPARVEYLCRYYTRHHNTRCLNNLLTVARSCFSKEHVKLVASHLLHVYDEKKDSSKAEELLQAEGISRQELPPVTRVPESGRQLTNIAN